MRRPNTRRKSGRPGILLRRSVAGIAVAACFTGSFALANPTAPTVAHGTAAFATAGNVLNVTNSPNAIINWGSFSIGVNELTRFIQPSALSAVLNRVTGQDPSAILGALQSNGRVFLVNPNGIVFGAGSQINVAGLVASTLSLSNDDFLNNRLRFTDGAGAGSVVNQGSITGGSVYLVGKAVSNEGLIASPNGEVILAAGNSVELVDPNSPELRVEIVAPDNEARNLGSIVADAGRVGIFAGLVNNSGTINADSAVMEGGRILLKATKNVAVAAGSGISASGTSGGSVAIEAGDTALVEGDITATGSAGAGGTVQVLGNLVGLDGDARIDASGETGGGTVRIGGDFQGANPDIQNAFRTHVGPDVTVNADAVAAGDGGRVIVWADDITRYYGSISARGGAAGGDGGFAEVSGKHALDFRGAVNLGAAQGAAGTLLLDPDFINISTGGFDFYSGPVLFGVAPATLSIHPGFLDFAAASIVLQANEDINVSDAITLSTPAADITLQAGGFLNVNAGITTSGGVITLVAGDPGAAPGQPDGGALNINAGLDTTGGGNAAGAAINLASHLSDVGGNSLRINAPVNAGTGGNVQITNTNASIEQTAAGVITGRGLWAQASNGDVRLDTAFNKVDVFAASASGIVKFSNDRDLALGDVAGNQGIVAAGVDGSGAGNVQVTLSDGSVVYHDLAGSPGSTIVAAGGGTTAIRINAASIGEAGGSLIEVNPGASGAVELTAQSGGIHVEQVGGTLATSRYTLSTPAGRTVELVSSGGSLQVDSDFDFPTMDLELETQGSNNIVFTGSHTANLASLAVAASGDLVLTGATLASANGPIELSASGSIGISGGSSVTAGTLSQSGIQMTAANGAVTVQDSTLTAAYGGPVAITAATGIDVSATTQATAVNGGRVTLVSGGDLNVTGGFGSAQSALISGSVDTTVNASGDVILTGGGGAGSYAKIHGADGVFKKVGGVIRMDSGAGNGAAAMIESDSPTSIHLEFPNLADGGYFINGIESAIVDPVTGSGFIAAGVPATLDSSLVVAYGLNVPPPPPPPPSPPPPPPPPAPPPPIADNGGSNAEPGGDGAENAANLLAQTLLVATDRTFAAPESGNGEGDAEEREPKKRDIPICK